MNKIEKTKLGKIYIKIHRRTTESFEVETEDDGKPGLYYTY